MADQHQHESDPLVGRMFHDYRIEKQLAKGGMGAVYLCRHRELPDVLKVLKVIASELEAPDPSASPEARANAERERAFVSDRFEREARAMMQLRHRYIVPIDGIDTMDGRRCILMPYLAGRSLEQLLQERGGRLTPHETLHIVAQTARALDYAHQQQIVHRDLKPANVLIVPSEDDELAIQVIDFGIAKQMQTGGPATAWRGPVGTLLFMAPEQFEHAHAATPQSDVYALAVMLYLMIEGRYPWGEQPNMFAQYRRQLETPPDPASGMPPGWEDSVRSALSPDPAQRPRSMQEFVYPIAAALEGGLEILRRVARRWASSSPSDETLRGGTANTGAWRAAMSGVWLAASGSWPAASSGTWPAGSWPGAASGSWPAAVASGPSSTTPSGPSSMTPSATFSTPATDASTRSPVAWKLVLLATVAAVLAGLVVFAIVRALEGR
jgi:serine/threonine protein kinase